MGKVKADKQLYERMRASGVRKRVARELAKLPRMGSDGKRVPEGVRQTFERLQAVVSELEGHAAGRGDRKASARKATRTRRNNPASLARKAAGSQRNKAKG